MNLKVDQETINTIVAGKPVTWYLHCLDDNDRLLFIEHHNTLRELRAAREGYKALSFWNTKTFWIYPSDVYDNYKRMFPLKFTEE